MNAPEKLVSIEARILAIESRLNNIEHKLRSGNKGFDDFESRLANIEARLIDIGMRLENIECQAALKSIEEMLSRIEARLAKMEQNTPTHEANQTKHATGKTGFNKTLEHLLVVKEGEVTLKWIFDHFRNYAIAAALFTAGVYLLQKPNTLVLSEPLSQIIGMLIAAVGLILAFLNIMQPLYAFSKNKVPAFISVIFFFVAIQFVALIIKTGIK